MQGFNTISIKDKKRIFMPYNFQIGYYFVRDTKNAKHEGQIQMEYIFRTYSLRMHYPKVLVPKHVKKVSISWPYTHEK
jgi:hypothetical protein